MLQYTMRILIVDDDTITQRLLTSFLSSIGDCECVADGEDAIARMKSGVSQGRPYDLVCLDIMMPNMDGQEALQELRALEERHGIAKEGRTKIVMTTALSDADNVMQSFNEQCDAYLVKPIDKEKLYSELFELGLIDSEVLAEVIR